MSDATYACEYCGSEFRSPFAMAACEMQCETDQKDADRGPQRRDTNIVRSSD